MVLNADERRSPASWVRDSLAGRPRRFAPGARVLVGLWLLLAGISCHEDDPIDAVLDCSAPEPFEACGGSLEGLWQATSGCAVEGGEVAVQTECGELTVTFDVGVSGSLEVSGTQATGTVTQRARYRSKVPKACLEARNAEQCMDVVPPEPLTICVDRGDSCLCSGTQILPNVRGGTASTEDGRLFLQSDDGEQVEFQYCVRGRILDLQMPADWLLGEATIRTRWLR